jgi:hypothetical protein
MCLSCRIFFSAWKVSAPQRRASRKARRAHGHDHEFLDVQVVVGVRAAVDDVHHRHGQLHGTHAAEVAVQGQAGFFGGGAATAIDTASMALAPRRPLLSVPSRSIRVLSRKALLGRPGPARLRDFGVDVLNRLQHALAQVAALVAVAQLDGFAANRWRRPTARPHGP